MPVMVISTFESSREEYDAVNEKLGAEPPQGGLVHTGGQLDDGRMQVVDVWESEADWENFRDNRLKAAIEEVVGGEGPVTQMQVYEIHDFQVAPNAGG
jgi:hypothetical protein